MNEDQKYIVAALYKFVDLPDYQSLKQPLLDLCLKEGIKGTLILAQEGINGTVAGSRKAIDALQTFFKVDGRFNGLSYKESWAEGEKPFLRMKVRLKNEIVTMRQPNVNAHHAGQYVKPKDWNALISDPEVVLVDTRNDYEIAIGTFKYAVNPNTVNFRDFPAWVEEQAKPGGLLADKKKVAMFCTGGIRCEKSTAYMKLQGFEEVYHLEGGVLKYLEEIDSSESLWQGECFVFDERVSVGHGLQPGKYIQCHACRHPLSQEDVESTLYIKGESCPHCHGTHTPEQIERFRERQLQADLAKQRNEQHVGADMESLIEKRRKEKNELKEKARQEALNKTLEKV